MTVTVLLMTYNHKRFIVQALESALTQRTSFPYEVLVSEDASTDGTREIVQEYQRRHPERIRLLLSERNLHSNEVVARGIRAARGRYIALLDGDDYWTSTDKLQRQSDFLDSHPECSACFHNAMVVHDDGGRAPWNWTPPGQKSFSTLADMWMGNFIATCSVMFRTTNFSRLPDWYIEFFPITDWPLHLLSAERGLIGYIPDVMGVYRYHAGGLYSPLDEEQKIAATGAFYRRMNACLEFRYAALVGPALSTYYLEWAEEYAGRGDLARARSCFRASLAGRPLVNKRFALRRLARLALRLYAPALLRLSRAVRDAS